MTTQQKQALAIGGGALGLLVIYRRRHKATTGGPTLTSGYGGSVAPYTPQTPITLDPGQTIYDPNNPGLWNTPTAPWAGNPEPTPPPQSNGPSGPGYVVNVNYPPVATKGHKRVKPGRRPQRPPAKPKHPKPKHPKPKVGAK